MSSEFKIGDKVRVSENYPKDIDDGFAGCVGELWRACGDGWDVGFDHDGWRDTTGRDHCWYIESEWLTKVEEKPKKPPQTYKGNGTQTYKGNGKHEWQHVAMDGQTFAVRRLRVPGGWLYRDERVKAMVFVPMPEVVKHKV
jgi:hypothetical protein